MASIRRANRTMCGGLLAVLASLVWMASPVSAAPVLDQSQVSGSGGSVFLYADVHLAQTFTAGQSGTLERVEFELARGAGSPDDVRVEIRNVSGGVPGDTVLGSGTIPAASIGESFGWTGAGLSATSVAGTPYAVVLTTTAPFSTGYYYWSQSSGNLINPVDLYPGGDLFSMFPGSTSWGGPGWPADFTFKTYVAAPTAPQTKQDCKLGGWQNFDTYNNQGQCVRTTVP